MFSVSRSPLACSAPASFIARPAALVLSAALLAAAVPAQAQQQMPAPVLDAKAWLLVEFGSGQTLASQNADQKIEPASLTKLMTAYLTFSALRQRVLTLDQTVQVSEAAWRAQGSRMFIDMKRPVTVEELIKGMIVQSGNDACIALAEAIAGGEVQFADLMNKEAARLGMTNTHFMNATGLPDPQHMTTATDLAKLATALIRDFPAEYGKYYSMKEFRYNNITQPNRNRLLFIDPSVDGVKTGHTDAAGYCLISSAKRGERRLLSVVLGTPSDGARAQESLKLLNYGYQYYDAVKLYAAGQPASKMRVWKGKESTVGAGFLNDFVIAVPKGAVSGALNQGASGKLAVSLESKQPLVAPINKGDVVGTLKITLEGKPYGEYPVVATEAVPVAGWFGRLWDTIRMWFA
ncbi:D-alanyl-D-alanine carboxypeptidase [Oryzomicrobium terrae]|uniref:serine-type D-Ala-D-Ala carboxypeptidase n=2 Tax=Oryzomicrobium terrae TaxID=1735038 RepID=A0A5C1E4J1_9RHOO|nr:D-alanyl-D-alanine carboxypeptidase [Oryzomicrobium terrae]